MNTITVRYSTTASARYALRTVDGDVVHITAADFALVNPADWSLPLLIAPGETYYGGGGAAPVWSLWRDEVQS